MALVATFARSEIDPIVGHRVYLRPPRLSDHVAWADLRGRSSAFLKPWEPTWSVDELSRGRFRHRVRRYARLAREDGGHAYFVFLRDGDTFVGGCTLSNIRRGVTQCGSLGYWIGEPYSGRGLMTDAVRTLLAHSFSALGLHRVEAACLPQNEPSKRLLRSVGFQPEGLARKYLKIDGEWRDHLLFAIVENDPRG